MLPGAVMPGFLLLIVYRLSRVITWVLKEGSIDG